MYALKLAVVSISLFFAANATRPPQAFAPVAVQDSQQPFAWSGSTGDLTIKLWLVQDRDSVYARGSYQVAPTKKVGCGGQSLPDKGLVTMRAKGSFASFSGKLLFDSGWTPPFSARKTSDTTMAGTIRSIDRGPCRVALHRVTPVRRGPPRP